jgi:hypothetical protein
MEQEETYEREMNLLMAVGDSRISLSAQGMESPV